MNKRWKCGCPPRPAGQLRSLLPRPGQRHSVLQNGMWPEPGRCDLLWFQRSPLAECRGRASDYHVHAAANLRSVRRDLRRTFRRSLSPRAQTPEVVGPSARSLELVVHWEVRWQAFPKAMAADYKISRREKEKCGPPAPPPEMRTILWERRASARPHSRNA